MNIPINIEQHEGVFVASVIGEPKLRTSHSTRVGAIAALRTMLRQRVSAGSIATIDVPTNGLLSLAGKYANDPSLRDICDDIYRERDAQPKE